MFIVLVFPLSILNYSLSYCIVHELKEQNIANISAHVMVWTLNRFCLPGGLRVMLHHYISSRQPTFWGFHSAHATCIATILAPNHYNIINATQRNSDNSRNSHNSCNNLTNNAVEVARRCDNVWQGLSITVALWRKPLRNLENKDFAKIMTWSPIFSSQKLATGRK